MYIWSRDPTKITREMHVVTRVHMKSRDKVILTDIIYYVSFMFTCLYMYCVAIIKVTKIYHFMYSIRVLFHVAGIQKQMSTYR